MAQSKQFISLNEVVLESIEPENIRTWLPINFDDNGSQESLFPFTKSTEKKCHKKLRPKTTPHAGSRTRQSLESCNVLNVTPEPRKRPDYLNYARGQKSISEQKLRLEEILTESLKNPPTRKLMTLDAPRITVHHKDVVQVESPIMTNDLQPRPPSQSPSLILPYIQSETLVELQAPKTGVRVNESEPLVQPKPLPEGYDPRELQRKFAMTGDKFYVTDKRGNLYAIPVPTRKSSIKPAQKLTILPKPMSQPQPTRQSILSVPAAKKKTKTAKKVSELKLVLGFPVGIQLGSYSITNDKLPSENRGQIGFACSLIAIGFTYLKRETRWNAKTLDRILQLGTELQSQNESQMKVFKIDDATIEVSFNKPAVTSNLCTELRDELDVHQALAKYLKKKNFIILQCRHLTFLIWHRIAHFVFDPAGRDTKCQVGNQAALMTLKGLPNVVHLLLNMSGLARRATFTITTIKIKNLKRGDEVPKPETPKVPKEMSYQIINPYKAIMRSDLHLLHPSFGSSRNRQSLAMSIAALTYTKIDPPATWRETNLKKILLIGNELYSNWSTDNAYLTLKDLPSSFQFAQFAISIKIKPFKAAVPVNKQGEEHLLFEALKSIMQEGTKALLQVDRMFFATWVKNKIYYLLDPYPRDERGDVCLNKFGKSCIHMFSYVQELSHIFRNNMIQTIPEGTIYLHVIEFDEIVPNPNGLLETALSLIQLGIPQAEEISPSITESVDYKIRELDQHQVNEEDGILVLDSPSLSMTSLTACNDKSSTDQGAAHEDTKVLDVDLSKLSIIPEEKPILKTVTPSVDYLCTLTANDLVDTGARDAVRSSIGMDTLSQVDDRIVADKVLFKSDLDHLVYRRKQIQIEPEKPKPTTECITKSIPITLSQELLLPTNFTSLPDGTQIIFGNQHLMELDTRVHIEYLLAINAISAVVVSFKYSIFTWSGSIVDYVLQITKALSDLIDSDGLASTFFTVPNHGLPVFELGQKKYEIRLEMIETDKFGNLKMKLEKLFERLQRVLIFAPDSSFVVFKRKNLYYMFEGYPCNIVGFREQNGRASFMRFKSLGLMFDRIEANRQELRRNSMVAVSQMWLKEVSDYDPYPKASPSMQELLLRNAKHENEIRIHEKQRQTAAIDAIIAEEQVRLAEFGGIHVPEQLRSSVTYSKSFVDGSRKASVAKSLKRPGKTYQYHSMTELTAHPLNPKSPCGYFQRSEDLLHKIQGSTSFADRCSFEPKMVRPCHFAAVYATLLTLYYPVTKWNHRKIDVCLEQGKEMYDKLDNRDNELQREVKDIQVENMLYHVIIVGSTATFKPRLRPLKEVLEANFINAQFIIVQFTNSSFAIHKDDKRLYHIFDSYPSLELCKPIKMIEFAELEEKKALLRNLQEEQNTASWILCVTIDDIISYLSKRTKSLIDFLVYKVQIVTYKKAPKLSLMSYFLYKSVRDDSRKNWLCGVTVEEKLMPEEIKLLDAVQMPPWSRLKPENLMKQPRGPFATWKQYDIEIDKELYSLWGNLHPASSVFNQPGKQYLAIYTVACGMATLYRLDHWNTDIIDSVVINGNQYFDEITEDLPPDHELHITDLSATYELNKDINLQFKLSPAFSGILYNTNPDEFNLSQGLTYFFQRYRMGILHLTGRALLIGKEEAYFMFDCQSHGPPLFQVGQGAPYLLRCCSLRRLMDVILITLNVRRYCVQFAISAIEVKIAGESENVSIAEPEPLDDEAEDVTDLESLKTPRISASIE